MLDRFQGRTFPLWSFDHDTQLEAIILSALILSSSNREGEQEKKIARKTLTNTKETNWMTEEILEAVRDLQEDVRQLRDEEEE